MIHLQPIYDNANSFYGKALIDKNKKGEVTLISYTTNVAKMVGNKLIINDYYSTTTASHIREFARQNGFKILSKKEMLGGIILTKL